MKNKLTDYFFVIIVVSVVLFVFFILYMKLYKIYEKSLNLKKRINLIKKQTEYGAVIGDQSSSTTANPKDEISDRRKAIEVWLTEKVFGYTRDAAERYRTRFEQAGWSPQKAPIITIFVTIVLIVLGVNVYIISLLSINSLAEQPLYVKFIGFIIVVLVCIRLFEYFMDYMIKSRYKRIQKSFTFCVDLLAICIRAGFSLGRSFEKIAEEVAYYNEDICKEFMHIAIELVIIPDRQIALRNFARRVDLPIVHVLVSGLVHAEEQGVSIGQTLMMLSQEFSKVKSLEIEKKAARLPVLLTIPLALFFLPVIFIVIIGPVVITFMRNF